MSRISIQRHAEWRIKLAAKSAFVDPIDAELDEMIERDRIDFNPPSRKKDADLARTLAILDEIEMEGGKA